MILYIYSLYVLSMVMNSYANIRNSFLIYYQYKNTYFRYLKVCGQEFSDEDINRAVGLLWTNSFACASGGGQVEIDIVDIPFRLYSSIVGTHSNCYNADLYPLFSYLTHKF